MNLKIKISPGELFDRITILEIKMKKFTDKSKSKIVSKELSELYKIKAKNFSDSNSESLDKYKKNLYLTNIKLWNIENKLRMLECKKSFNKKFIELARKVYQTNDKRTEIKNTINKFLGVKVHELKEYKKNNR